MTVIPNTPKCPYYAVIFTSIASEDDEGYDKMSQQMEDLARKQKGFLGVESARNKIGVTISYWEDLESIKNWKNNSKHLVAQKIGKDRWYKNYKVRICKVEREYGFV